MNLLHPLECHPDSVHPVAAKFGSEFRATENGVGNDRSSGWAVQRVVFKALREGKTDELFPYYLGC